VIIVIAIGAGIAGVYLADLLHKWETE